MRFTLPEKSVVGLLGIGISYILLTSGSLLAQERPAAVNVAISGVSFVHAPYVIARDKGYFRQEGIEIRFIRMQSSIVTKALVTRDVDFNTLGSPTINTAIAGLPIRAVFANGDRTNMHLIASREIQSVQDLKGKKIGVGGIADLGELGTRRFLKAKGVDPREVIFIVLGGGSSIERFAAVMSGFVAAAPLSPPFDYRAKKAGLKLLGYYGDTFPSYYGGIGVHIDFMRERRRIVKGFIKASLKGLKFMHSRRAETVAMMMPHLRLTDGEMVEAIYDSSVNGHTKDGLLSPEIQREIIAIALEALGRTGEVKPDAVFDFSLVREAARELEAEGWKP